MAIVKKPLFHVALTALIISASVAAKPTIEYTQSLTGARTGLEAAIAYLGSQSDEFRFVEEKQSLLGTHYTFAQYVGGIPIENAQVTVSVRDEDLAIYKVFNSQVQNAKSLVSKQNARLKEYEAYDIAWRDLGVRGALLSKPTIALTYRLDRGKLRLVYDVRLAVEAPFGYWQHTIDAATGKVLRKVDRRLTRRPKGGSLPQGAGPLRDRLKEFSIFEEGEERQNDAGIAEETETSADGEALVFDPDPRTALNDPTLKDDSPAEKFDPAYVSRALKGLTVAGGKYKLKGPWVQIQDFEPPQTAASTTADGKWTNKRGNSGFNDVMTYFHIDQSQRYIQSLGFTGARGIQYRSIAADSDGVGGDDNSHFIPGENKISFGHGCVDDNEDADVILHEYGHAIEDSINSNFDGGDTGAIGEGFGDYWAASYSITTTNGSTFFPEVAFTWDSGGEGGPCWTGRRLDVANAKYDHNRTYYAHQSVGSFVSDELWSTPLFQTLRELLAQGFPRAHVDQIILEAHFGLGPNIKMRDMANSIVHAAQTLFPDAPYADVFKKHFVAHNILDVPHASFEIQKVVLGNAGQNNVLDPGETVEISLTLRNTGNIPGQAIKAHLSTQNVNATISQADSDFADLAASAEGVNVLPFVLNLSSLSTCGESIALNLDLEFDGGQTHTQQIVLEIQTGASLKIGGSSNLPVTIPDNDLNGVTSSIWLEDGGTLKETDHMELEIELRHNYLGDLKVSLLAPSGKEVILHDRSVEIPNLIGTYPTTLVPAEDFAKLLGETLQGEWKLKMVDVASADVGALLKWGLKAVSGYQCEVP